MASCSPPARCRRTASGTGSFPSVQPGCRAPTDQARPCCGLVGGLPAVDSAAHSQPKDPSPKTPSPKTPRIARPRRTRNRFRESRRRLRESRRRAADPRPTFQPSTRLSSPTRLQPNPTFLLSLRCGYSWMYQSSSGGNHGAGAGRWVGAQRKRLLLDECTLDGVLIHRIRSFPFHRPSFRLACPNYVA